MVPVPPGVTRIIIAEDSSALGEIYTNLIKDNFRDVSIDLVEDGRSLVDRVRDSKYDIILTDNRMPPKDGIGHTITGLEAIREIRGFEKNIPIIMLCNSNAMPYESVAIQAGANKYFDISRNIWGELTQVLAAYGLRKKAC